MEKLYYEPGFIYASSAGLFFLILANNGKNTWARDYEECVYMCPLGTIIEGGLYPGWRKKIE